MSITTSGFYQKNIDLFSRLNKDVADIQVQVSTGNKSLSLKNNLQEISHLNASEEHKLEVTQFNNNAERAISDLEKVDTSFGQLSNAAVRLKELFVESTNGFRSLDQRKMFKVQIASIKTEIMDIANGTDALGNGYFSGDSGVAEPFKIDNFGKISYSGSASAKSLQISRNSELRQNFSGAEVFLSAGQANAKFSVFDAIDSFSQSLDYEIAPKQSSNLLSNGTSLDFVFPGSGQEANFKFDLVANGTSYAIDSNVYGNDFSSVVAKINSHSGSSGVTAVVSSNNKITISGTGVDLKVENYVTDLPVSLDRSIGVQKTVASNVNDEIILPNSMTNAKVESQIYDVFEHFSSMRADLGAAVQTAQNVAESAQETLVNLNVDILNIKEADMTDLLTKLQNLLNNKEAAQATFSRISSKNLFDYFG
jgi:flagellar hook-associated protein 3 FlgL